MLKISAGSYSFYCQSESSRLYFIPSSSTAQGQCGASYAFSAMAALEGANALATGRLTVLSEQNIIDCSGIVLSYA